MKRAKTIYLAALICIISYSAYSQTDSLRQDKIHLSKSYLGLGFGTCNSGLGGVFSGTFILSNDWGGSIRYNPNALGAKNLPDDYYDIVLFIPFLTNGLPTDNIHVLSFLLLKEFPTQTKFVRFGIEFGPAFVKYEVARFTSVSNPIPFMGSNYDVSHDNNSSIGFSVRAKAEFPLTRFAGLEIAPNANINGFRSVLDIDFCLTLGLVR